ncbi:MAG: hypothetical protein KKC68_07435, partial [Candidatus Thermoplasmatota archaeon]|nr:hypothetical protein [Candidatus Thermoplasmatota archaeon]
GYLTPPLGRRVGLGVYNPLWDETYYAQGWINTIGLNGVKKWEGTLKGNLSISHRLILHHPSISTGLYEIYEGINGFKGLKIGRSNTFFIGFARQVKIDEIVIL